MNRPVESLQSIEWAAGNRCPECAGLRPGAWYAAGLTNTAPTPNYEGHARGCALARSLRVAGHEVLYASKMR